MNSEDSFANVFIAVFVTTLLCVGLGVVLVTRYKDEAYRLRQTVEVSELSVAAQKREVMSARKEAEAAKNETAMCRRAVGYADKANANLEAALKAERSGK